MAIFRVSALLAEERLPGEVVDDRAQHGRAVGGETAGAADHRTNHGLRLLVDVQPDPVVRADHPGQEVLPLVQELHVAGRRADLRASSGSTTRTSAAGSRTVSLSIVTTYSASSSSSPSLRRTVPRASRRSRELVEPKPARRRASAAATGPRSWSRRRSRSPASRPRPRRLRESTAQPDPAPR